MVNKSYALNWSILWLPVLQIHEYFRFETPFLYGKGQLPSMEKGECEK
jgi:hypothetical protein